MPFLQLQSMFNKNNSTVNSLRTNLGILHQIGLIKRASSSASRKLNASMTVEAAFALPLFMFFMVNMILVINIIGMQSRFNAALHQVGNKMAFYGYAYEKTVETILPDGLASVALTGLYAKEEIKDYVGESCLNQSCIKNGAAGISFDGTAIMERNDIIEICLSYKIMPVFRILGFDSFEMGQRYYGRAWTGYDVESGISDFTQEDPMVYITETGTVYHTNRNCTYLNPAVTSVDSAHIADERNQSGGKYYPCEICGSSNIQETIYITSQGSSYHTTFTCPGLKRTVYTIPLSQAGGRGRCSRCR